MSYKTYKLTTCDGASADLRIYSPTKEKVKTQSESLDRRPIFLCLPAMGVPARKYEPLAIRLNQSNFIVALFEWRGIGSSSERASRKTNFGYHEILHFDLPEALMIVRSQYPNNPIYLLGHSLGGQLSMLYMSINPQEISGMVGIATGTPYFKGWHFPQNIALFLASKLMKTVAFIKGHFPGKSLGFAGRESRQLINDWAYSVHTGQYKTKHMDGHFEEKIDKLTKEALFITIEEDWLAPPQSTHNLANKLTNGEVVYLHLSSPEMPKEVLGHFNWMKQPNLIAEKIEQWLTNKSVK